MSVKSYFMKTGRRIGAAFLSAAMVVSLVSVPASAAADKGEDVIWDFDASSQQTVNFTEHEAEENKYQAEHLFLQENNEELNQKLGNSEDCELKVRVKIVDYDGDWSKLAIMPFVAAADTEGGWKNGWTQVEAGMDTYDLTVDLSSHQAAGLLGFRFIQIGDGEADKSISYEVLSAKIVSYDAAGSGTGGSTGGDTVENLVVDYGAAASKTETFSPNAPDYMTQFIVNHYFINGLTNEVGGQSVAGNNWELQVEVKVTDYKGDKDKMEMFLFAMDENYTNWGEGARKKLSGEDSYTLTYDLSKHSNFQQLGLRFFQEENVDNKITYEILSAKIMSQGEKEPELDDSELTDFNETLDEGNWNDKKEVTVAENIYVPGQFLIKHQFRNIPHDLSMGGLGGFEALRMKVNVTVHSYTKGDNSNAEALIYAMDGSYENWKQNQVLLNGDGSEQTVEITLDLSQCYMLHPRESLGEIGFEITGLKDGTPVEYTINDARIIGKGAANQILTNIKLKDEYKLTGGVKHVSYENTPVGKHGKLSVQNVDGYSAPVVVDKNGKPYQLRGASSHGLSWFPEYVNEDAYRSLRDEWGMNMVRIAIYPREGEYGYISDKLGPSKDNAAEYNDELIMKGVEAAKKLGMYVMIDWHVLDYNPNRDTEEATAFFRKYAQLYKDYDNVLFEICNEPAGTKWYNGEEVGNDLYTYCKTVTQAIRDEKNDAIVICGTNNFSQDVDEVAEKPLSEDGFENIMYTCHFYAATHYDTQFNRLKGAVEKSGIPVFITEFGICTASGDGYYDTDAADKWLDYCDENGIGYSCWAMSNSTESAAYFKTTCTKLSGWTEDDLTVTSTYLVNRCNDTAKKLGDAVGFSLENEGDHAYTQTVTKAATCTEAGVSTFTCSCGHSYTAPIPATGHSKQTVLKNVKAATSTADGYTGDECCIVCGSIVKAGTVIPKTGAPDVGTVITDPATKEVYRVTVSKKEVTYVKSGNSKATNVNIKKTVKLGGITYKVTAIDKAAFKNNKKLKKVTIGANVKKIGKQAFYNCKSLKQVTIQTTKLKASSIGKAAFKKTKSSLTVKAPKKKLASYKKLLVNAGVSKKATIKKK